MGSGPLSSADEGGLVLLLVLLAKLYCYACFGTGGLAPDFAQAYLAWDASRPGLTWRERPELAPCLPMAAAVGHSLERHLL